LKPDDELVELSLAGTAAAAEIVAASDPDGGGVVSLLLSLPHPATAATVNIAAAKKILEPFIGCSCVFTS
jgi:hypothetical protein